MSQVDHIVAAQYERAIGRVYRSLRISVSIRFSEFAVLTVKFVSTAGWTTSGRRIDSVQAKAASLKKWSAVPACSQTA
jgi:hypothetical protein